MGTERQITGLRPERENTATPAAHTNRSGIFIQDNRTSSVLQQVQKEGLRIKRNTAGCNGILQAVWYDEEGIPHDGVAPPGYEKVESNHGVYWVPGKKEREDNPGSDNENEESEISEYEQDSDEDRYNANDPDEKFRGKGGDYRSSRSFYKGKDKDTRKIVTKRQRSPGGRLHSGSDGKGEVIDLDSRGREIREHKTEGAKDRQPEMDHIRDFVIVDDAADRLAQEKGDMSEAEVETLKDELYNDEGNIEILSKKEHSDKKRTTREKITDTQKKEADKYVKERKAIFDKDERAQKRRDDKRKRLKKKEDKEEMK